VYTYVPFLGHVRLTLSIEENERDIQDNRRLDRA
jgi:hypothetical protein